MYPYTVLNSSVHVYCEGKTQQVLIYFSSRTITGPILQKFIKDHLQPVSKVVTNFDSGVAGLFVELPLGIRCRQGAILRRPGNNDLYFFQRHRPWHLTHSQETAHISKGCYPSKNFH